MIIVNKKLFSKKIIIIGSSLILLAIGSLGYVYIFNGSIFGWKSQSNTTSNNNEINYSPAITEQQKAGNDTKNSTADTPPTPKPIPNSTKKKVQISITAANQNDSNLQIRILISAVENTGICTLTLTRAGAPTITKTADTQALSNTSTCRGFDIPTAELSIGSWQINITYDSNTLSGSATKGITIQ